MVFQTACTVIDFPYSDHDALAIKMVKRFNHNWENSPDTFVNKCTYKIIVPNTATFNLSQRLASYDWNDVLFPCMHLGAEHSFSTFFSILIDNVNYVKVLKRSKQNHRIRHAWYTGELAKLKDRVLFYTLCPKIIMMM